MTALPMLPVGVEVRDLDAFHDHRGAIVELDRLSWAPSEVRAQWTLSSNAAGVMRGTHVHIRHHDRITVLDGDVTVGLVDLRRSSATAGLRATFTLAPFETVSIPPLVVHGFWGASPTVYVNATSHEYEPSDDLEVRFDDPHLGLEWPTREPVLSNRDRRAPSLSQLLDRCAAAELDVISVSH